MKPVQNTTYACEICGHQYGTEAMALRCEKRPVTHDNVNVGDEVTITSGEGTGLKLKVEQKWIVDAEWGHYQADRYWHTVAVSGPVIGSWGNRTLTFDSWSK